MDRLNSGWNTGAGLCLLFALLPAHSSAEENIRHSDCDRLDLGERRGRANVEAAAKELYHLYGNWEILSEPEKVGHALRRDIRQKLYPSLFKDQRPEIGYHVSARSCSPLSRMKEIRYLANRFSRSVWEKTVYESTKSSIVVDFPKSVDCIDREKIEQILGVMLEPDLLQ